MLPVPRPNAIFRALLALVCVCFPVPFLGAQTTSRTVQATLTASPQPSRFEQNIDILLILSVPSGGAAPGGTVQFFFDGVAVGSPQAVINNVAEYLINTPMYGVGPYTVSASYSGDLNYDPLPMISIPHTIIRLRTEIPLTIKTPTIYYGQILNAVAKVTPVDSAPRATLNGGTTTFLIDGSDICEVLYTGGTMRCPDSAEQGINAGQHVLVATYSGNQYYEPSTSPDGDFTVLPDDTSTSLGTSLSPSLYGQSVTFSAAVTARYATPVGPVAFYDGVTPIGTGALDASAVAAVSVSTLTVGTHSITATYAGTPNFNGSSSTSVKQVVVLPPAAPVGTATLLTSSLNPSVLGQSVTFTASVATTGAFVQIPAGTVTFLDGTSVLGTATLDATGSAQYTTSSLALGQHRITVSYAGTSAFATNVSATLLQVIVASLTSAGNGFLLTVTPVNVAVGVGNYVSVSVNVLPLNGFNEPVQLSCISAPAEMRCLFDSVLIPAGGGTTRLTLNPAAPHDCGSETPYFRSAGRAELFPLLAGIVALLFRRRRRWLRAVGVSCLLAVLPMFSGCGHCTDLGVKPGSYTFAVQGSSTGSAAVTHAVGMSMNVHL